MFKRFIKWLHEGETKRDPDAEAAARWWAHNERARAEGCRCGGPSEVVRYVGGTKGGVPCEIWSCREHRNVNAWQGQPGAMEPVADFDDASRQWVSQSFDVE